MKNNKNRKAFVLSVAMAALMLSPITSNAQYREDRYGLQEWGQTSLMGKNGVGGNNRDGGASVSGGISNYGIGETVPMGSGLLILLGAGLGYVALKKKEDEQ